MNLSIFMGLRERLENFTNGPGTVPSGPGFLRYLLGWTLTLAFVFSFTGDGDDDWWSLAARFSYWCAHVGTGLLVISVVSALLQRGPCARLPSLVQLALYGLAGAIAFTPLAVLFETSLPVPGAPEGSRNWLTQATQEGWLRASLGEFAAFAPSFLGSWLVINLAYVVPTRVVATNPENSDVAATPKPGAAVATEPASVSGLGTRLPQALGTDIIHLRADLNYLHVTTTGGSTMILYSLARAAEELGELGLMVHRAHWVASAHVTRTRRTAQGLVLTLSNGTEVPVSRRRQPEIRARFGDSYQAPAQLRA